MTTILAIDPVTSQRFKDAADVYTNLVYAAALRQLKDPGAADDATQAAFLILLRKLPALESSRPLGPWLLTVTRYVCNDIRKRRQRQMRHEQEAAAMRTENVPLELAQERAELSLCLDDALAALPKHERTVVILRYFEQRSVEDAAAVLGVPAETAKKRLARGLARLRNYFRRRGITVGDAAVVAGIAAATQVTAPTAISASVLAISQGAAMPNALALANAVLKTMLIAKAKIISFAGIVVLVMAGGLSMAVVQAINSVKAPVYLAAAPVPATTPMPAATTSAGNDVKITLERIKATPYWAQISPEIRELIENIQTAELKLKNIEIESHSLYETWSQEKNAMVYNGETDSTAWYLGALNSKGRIDFHKRVLPLGGSPGKFIETQQSFSYNGQIGQLLELRVQLLDGQIVEHKVGVVDPTASVTVFHTKGDSGLFGTIYGTGGQDKLSDIVAFNAMLQCAKPDRAKVRVVREQRAGLEMQVVTIERGKESWHYVLCVSQGMALHEFEEFENGHRTQFGKVDGLRDVGDGIYFPTKVVSESFNPEADNPEHRLMYMNKRAVANSPEFSDDIFTIKWPEGTPVRDLTTDLSFRAGR